MALVDEQPDAAADALPEALRAQLPTILAAARAALAPAPAATLVTELTRALSLGLGQGMSEAEKTEFYVSAAEELEALPAEWAIEGIRRARKEVDWAKKIVPYVIAYAEDYPDRDRARLRRLEALCEIVGVPTSDEQARIGSG